MDLLIKVYRRINEYFATYDVEGAIADEKDLGQIINYYNVIILNCD